MKKNFTIIVYSENRIGLLGRITLIFTRRHINIESLTVSNSEIEGVSRYTILVHQTEEIVRKVVDQIAKQVEVIRAFQFTDEETIFQEISLYKIAAPKSKTQEPKFLELLSQYNAHVVYQEEAFVVVENTGHAEETDKLFAEFNQNGYTVGQFSRSGRIAVSIEPMEVSNMLKEFDQ
ncbi:MAG: acetolactate synthase small subunit [Flavobacteriaceae bacterium]|nr:MAG: acetolactate synthase small subunit [Flavobacteriaceae bacterium]